MKNLHHFSQRLALLDEPTFNFNTGHEIKNADTRTMRQEAFKLPREFGKGSLGDRTETIEEFVKEFIKDNSELLVDDNSAIRGEIFMGELTLSAVMLESNIVVIDPQ